MRGSGAFRTSAVPGGALVGPWVRNSLWRNARAVPSLDLQLADNKSLVDGVTGQNLVTFTRASSGTYVGSDGLIQTAVTNLLLQSEDFGTTWFLTSATLSANAIAAPNGSLTAEQLIEAATTANHEVGQTFASPIANATYTLSCYLKAATSTTCGIRFSSGLNGTGIICSVDLTAQTATVTAGTGTATITNVGSGWFRVSLTATASGTPASTGANIFRSIGTAGSIANSIYLWGAQLEQASTVGDYVPTTSAVNSAPRFDHNPTTGESLGLLVEEARTNLVLRSEEFDSGSWTKIATTVTADAIVSPSGALNADKLAETTANSTHYAVQSVSVTATSRTASIYVKAGERTQARIEHSGNTGGAARRITINLSTGTITGASTIGTGGLNSFSESIVSVGNGWYRVISTIDPTVTLGNTEALLVQVLDSTGQATYTGDGTSGFYVWGAQLEAGAFPTSYVPTTSATVTRAADVASITGASFGTTRTNLLVGSESFNRSPWSLGNVSVIPTTTTPAPDGTSSAVILTENTAATSFHFINYDITKVASAIQYTYSVYAKAAGRELACSVANINGGFVCRFNLATGAISQPAAAYGTGFTAQASVITPVGNNWYRCSITGTTDATTSITLQLSFYNTTLATNVYTGDGVSGVYAWGAQLETGSAATPYIPSTTTFTSRASGASYFDAAGVLQWKPQNLLLRSEEFDNTGTWSRTGLSTVTANAAVAPDGLTTADALVEDASTGNHRVFAATAASVVASTPHSFSVYVKASTRNRVRVEVRDSAGAFSVQDFDLTTQVITSAGSGTGTISSVGNGWFRCTASGTTSVSGGSATVLIYSLQVIGNATYTGTNGTSAILVWGAQLEQNAGSFVAPGEYTPTLATATGGARNSAFLPDSSGVFRSTGPLLLEEARTNYIRNNTGVGAVAGTPGTGPTNWGVGAATDLTRTVVGTGIENGINYVDIRYTGTVTAARTQYIFVEASNNIAAVNGQSWTGSVWLKIAAGSLSNISNVFIQADTRDSSIVYVNTPYGVNVTPTTTLTRFFGTGTATGTTAWIQPFILFNTATSGLVDITLRIGMPQLELGAFPTSVIPTSTSAVTRAADVSTSTATSVFESSWYNQNSGTVYAEYRIPALALGTISSFDDGTANNRWQQRYTATALRHRFVATGSTIDDTDTALVPSISILNKAAYATTVADQRYAGNGTLNNTARTQPAMPVVTQLQLGVGVASDTSGQIRISRLTYWPTRLANTTLQQITQP